VPDIRERLLPDVGNDYGEVASDLFHGLGDLRDAFLLQFLTGLEVGALLFLVVQEVDHEPDDREDKQGPPAALGSKLS
jgi:hypothetical protein